MRNSLCATLYSERACGACASVLLSAELDLFLDITQSAKQLLDIS